MFLVPVSCASLSALPPGRGAGLLPGVTACTEPFGGLPQADPALPPPSPHRDPAARPSSSHPASPSGVPARPGLALRGPWRGPRAPLTPAPSAPGPAARRDAAPGAGPWSRGCSAASAGLRKCGPAPPRAGPSPHGPPRLPAPERPTGRPPPSAGAAGAPRLPAVPGVAPVPLTLWFIARIIHASRCFDLSLPEV